MSEWPEIEWIEDVDRKIVKTSYQGAEYGNSSTVHDFTHLEASLRKDMQWIIEHDQTNSR